MADTFLGELEVVIGGETFTLRPEFGPIMEMEQRAGCSIAAMINKSMEANLSLTEVTAIVYCGIKGKTPSTSMRFEEVGRRVMLHGFNEINLLRACMKFIGAIYSGQSISEQETPDEEEEKKKGGSPQAQSQ